MAAVPLGAEWLKWSALKLWIPGFILEIVIYATSQKIKKPYTIPALMLVASMLFYAYAWRMDLSTAQLQTEGWLLVPYSPTGTWEFALSPAILSQVDWGEPFDQIPALISVAIISVVGLLAALLIVATLFVGTSAILHIPKFVFGSVLIYLGIEFLVEWVYEAWLKFSRIDFFVIVTILVTLAVRGVLEAVIAGLILAVFTFVVSYSRVSVIKFAFTGRKYHSRVTCAPDEQKVLEVHGDELYINASCYQRKLMLQARTNKTTLSSKPLAVTA